MKAIFEAFPYTIIKNIQYEFLVIYGVVVDEKRGGGGLVVRGGAVAQKKFSPNSDIYIKNNKTYFDIQMIKLLHKD